MTLPLLTNLSMNTSVGALVDKTEHGRLAKTLYQIVSPKRQIIDKNVASAIQEIASDFFERIRTLFELRTSAIDKCSQVTIPLPGVGKITVTVDLSLNDSKTTQEDGTDPSTGTMPLTINTLYAITELEENYTRFQHEAISFSNCPFQQSNHGTKSTKSPNQFKLTLTDIPDDEFSFAQHLKDAIQIFPRPATGGNVTFQAAISRFSFNAYKYMKDLEELRQTAVPLPIVHGYEVVVHRAQLQSQTPSDLLQQQRRTAAAAYLRVAREERRRATLEAWRATRAARIYVQTSEEDSEEESEEEPDN